MRAEAPVVKQSAVQKMVRDLGTAVCSAIAFATFGVAQQNSITIQVIDGKSGNPVSDARVLVFTGDTVTNLRTHKGSKEAHTNQQGLAIIPIDPETTKWIQPWVDWKHQCSENPNEVHIEVEQIKQTGVQGNNACGKATQLAIPGRLTLFVRNMTLKEKMDL